MPSFELSIKLTHSQISPNLAKSYYGWSPL
jgi:hypothetical protein